MSIRRTIHYPTGGTLLLFNDGRKRYIPSPAYLRFKEEQSKSRTFSKRECTTGENVFKLFAAIFGHDKISPFKIPPMVKEASKPLAQSFWKN